ncbi:MAG TPA: aminotransferase class III-fold pyridoxal phosphate-dependent enzyme, partial [Polyangiaceae bacterium]|nr:aminotransferase class III-fold pyridoxal phosphate-dependent enzyme [Polyangiaceae bacterium]
MSHVEPAEVHATLGRHLIASGHPLVLDLARSQGTFLYDALGGTEYLDFAGFYASNALGFRHPSLETETARQKLLESAAIKVGNPEFYTVAFAEFVAAVERIAAPSTHPHYFFVEGGALAVENAMKAAMDWKVRHNLARGLGEIGTEILHFERAFHGRAGYTLSVTNTDPAKTQYFPKFDWPRVPSPALRFPRSAEHDAATLAAEQACLSQIESAFEARPHRIAAILIEPIQGEGGDNHFRPEFLQALRRIADQREALLIFDE